MMIIRKLERKDVERCENIVRMNWSDVVARRFKREMEGAWSKDFPWPPMYYVAVDEDDDHIIGFAGMMWSWIMTGVMDFIWINVSPAHQNKGVGRALTEYRLKLSEEMGVDVIQLMTKKYGFFKKMGFHVMHVYGGDWVHMCKQLNRLDIELKD